MSLARKLALNTVIQLSGKVLSTITGIIVISLMTRRLGAEGFGAYSTANAFLQIFALVMDIGINVTFPAILGEHAHDEKYQERLFSAIFTLRLIMSAVVILLIAPLVAFVWPFPLAIKIAVVALSLSYVFPNLQQILIGVQQQRLRMGLSSIAENVGRLVNIAGLLMGPFFGWGLTAQCWIISVSSFSVFAINAWSVQRFLPLRWNWDPETWLMVLKRSWPVGLSIGLNLVYYKADTLILQHYRPGIEVGWYGAAYRVLEVLITVPFLYAGILLPILSKTWRDRRKEDLSALISRSLDVMILLTLPLIVGMYWFGERSLVLISGPEFIQAGSLSRILIFAVAAIYFNTILSYTIVALQAQRRMLPVYALTAVITLVSYFAFIPKYGAIAAAWLTVASESLILFGSAITVWRFVRFLPSGRLLAGTLVAAGAMWASGFYLSSLPLVLGIVLMSLIYAGLLLATKTVTPNRMRELFTINEGGPSPLGQ